MILGQEEEEEKHENSFSSSGLRRKKKGTSKVAPEASPPSSSPSSNDQTAKAFKEKRCSESTATSLEHADNLSSRREQGALLNGFALADDEKIDDNANDLNNILHLSEARITNSSNLWVREVMAKSNDQKNYSRSNRRSQSRRSSRGSNSIRSVRSHSRSRSSHGSISIHTMESHMDSGTDSDLDHEIVSDADDDDHYCQDEEYLTEPDSESEDDIDQYDEPLPEKCGDDKHRTSMKPGSSPTESHDKNAGPLESSKPMITPTKELESQSLPQQHSQNCEALSQDPLKENGRASDKKIKVGGILRNSILVSNDGTSKINGKKKTKGKSSFGNIGRNSAATKQVLWAMELKEEYSHHSAHRTQIEMNSDYAMPLKKVPSNSLKRHSADAFFELLRKAENSTNKSNTRGSFSSDSIYTLNSSNRQDSLPDVFDLESMVNSQSQRRTSFNSSFHSQVSSNMIDSGRDTRIELTSTTLSHHEEAITIPLAGDKKTDVDWVKVNKRLQNRREVEVMASDRVAGQRYSYTETDPDLSEDFFDPFFAPREERKSASSLDVPILTEKSSSENNGGKGKCMGPNSSQDSNFIMEYSLSRHPGEHAQKSSLKSEKSSSESSDRIQQQILRWVFAFLLFLVSALLLYFFVRPDSLEEDQLTEIDTLFVVNP